MDTERIDLRAPLPGGALAAHMVFKGSHFGRDRTVKRSVATHAELKLELIGPRTETKRLTMAEAEQFLEEAARLHATGAMRDAQARQSIDARQEARRELAASVTVECHRCRVPMGFEGRRDLLSAGDPARLDVTGDRFGQLKPVTRTYYEYACPRCGSVEWFRHGQLDHPVSGSDGAR